MASNVFGRYFSAHISKLKQPTPLLNSINRIANKCYQKSEGEKIKCAVLALGKGDPAWSDGPILGYFCVVLHSSMTLFSSMLDKLEKPIAFFIRP
jgi:hypothetical protein